MKYFWIILCAVLLVTAVSCSKKKVPTQADLQLDTAIDLVTTNDQALTAGEYYPDFIQLSVTDEQDNGVEGVEVRLNQITPNDRNILFDRTVTTDVNGNISLAYLADTLVGADTMQIIATGAIDSLVDLALTVIPAGAHSINLINADTAFTGIAGEVVADTVKVQVVDVFNNAIADSRVLFKARSRCLVITDSTALLPVENDSVYTRTDTTGTAWGIWHLSVNRLPFVGWPNLFTMYVIGEMGDTISLSGLSTTPPTIDYFSGVRPIFEANCFLCHPTVGSLYSMNTYDSTVINPIVIPGDTLNSTMLSMDYATSSHEINDINVIEEDKIRLWIGYFNAVDGTPPPISAHAWNEYQKTR